MNASHERATVGGTTLRGRGHSYLCGHGWMMIACCVPMLVAAVVLVAAGVVSPGFLLVAVGCMVMMAGMGHGSDRRA
jgi:hypothetical protein